MLEIQHGGGLQVNPHLIGHRILLPNSESHKIEQSDDKNLNKPAILAKEGLGFANRKAEHGVEGAAQVGTVRKAGRLRGNGGRAPLQ